MSSFSVPFPPIVLTYGSIATKASMPAMPSSNRCKILMRIFHSFIMNAKKSFASFGSNWRELHSGQDSEEVMEFSAKIETRNWSRWCVIIFYKNGYDYQVVSGICRITYSTMFCVRVEGRVQFFWGFILFSIMNTIRSEVWHRILKEYVDFEEFRRTTCFKTSSNCSWACFRSSNLSISIRYYFHYGPSALGSKIFGKVVGDSQYSYHA